MDFITVGNSGITITVTCLDFVTGNAVNLTGGSAKITLRLNGITVVRTMTLTTPASGIVTYTLVAGDTTSSGTMDCEVTCTLASGAVITGSRFKVIVKDTLLSV